MYATGAELQPRHSRTLLFGTSCIRTQWRAYEVDLWCRMHSEISAEADQLIIDTPGGITALRVAERYGFVQYSTERSNRRAVFTFDDNIGHFSSNGVDGWGRAFWKGIELAAAHDYDYVVYQDCDIICPVPSKYYTDKLRQTNVSVMTPLDMHYQFIENGIMAAQVGYISLPHLRKQYDQFVSKQRLLPEHACELIWRDVLLLLPFRGLRNDARFGSAPWLTRDNWHTAFPFGCDYLTHCNDFMLYANLLYSKQLSHIADSWLADVRKQEGSA